MQLDAIRDTLPCVHHGKLFKGCMCSLTRLLLVQDEAIAVQWLTSLQLAQIASDRSCIVSYTCRISTLSQPSFSWRRICEALRSSWDTFHVFPDHGNMFLPCTGPHVDRVSTSLCLQAVVRCLSHRGSLRGNNNERSLNTLFAIRRNCKIFA